MAKNLFTDYDGFVEKFKPKKTTDDCCTPQWLYDMVLDYVDKEIHSLEGLNIVRPFWPGERYDQREYGESDAVIDNPPFSILANITEFYRLRRVPFFLFAPSLTLGATAKDDFTAIVCGASVTYANGAQVPTSFVTNMADGNPAIIVAGALNKRMSDRDREERKQGKAQLPIYDMPDGVLSSARLQKIANAGLSLRIERSEARFVRKLESMGRKGKGIFGAGWIVSREAAAREAAAREAAARETAAREAAAREAAARERVRWPLSKQEEMLMDSLSEESKHLYNQQKL